MANEKIKAATRIFTAAAEALNNSVPGSPAYSDRASLIAAKKEALSGLESICAAAGMRNSGDKWEGKAGIVTISRYGIGAGAAFLSAAELQAQAKGRAIRRSVIAQEGGY